MGCVPNFRCKGSTVQPAERNQTHRQTDPTENISSSVQEVGIEPCLAKPIPKGLSYGLFLYVNQLNMNAIHHMVVSTCYPFIGKTFPYISCLSLHCLHEELTLLLSYLGRSTKFTKKER